MKKSFKKRIFQYNAIFEADSVSGGYAVSIPALPGCISEGDTFELAEKNIKEAAGLYLEVMKGRRAKVFYPENVIIAPVRVVA